jgi:hypothetical protein
MRRAGEAHITSYQTDNHLSVTHQDDFCPSCNSVVTEHSIRRWVHGLIFVVVFLRKTLYAPDHAWSFIALGCSSLHYMGLAWSVISVDYFPLFCDFARQHTKPLMTISLPFHSIYPKKNFTLLSHCQNFILHFWYLPFLYHIIIYRINIIALHYSSLAFFVRNSSYQS